MAELIELYQPSNGTEGDIFMGEFCFKCAKLPHDSDAKNQCWILGRAMIHGTDNPRYPNQWRYQDGKPVCTAFKDREEANAERRASRKQSPKPGDPASLDMFD